MASFSPSDFLYMRPRVLFSGESAFSAKTDTAVGMKVSLCLTILPGSPDRMEEKRSTAINAPKAVRSIGDRRISCFPSRFAARTVPAKRSF